jgi:hypothetical protein
MGKFLLKLESFKKAEHYGKHLQISKKKYILLKIYNF